MYPSEANTDEELVKDPEVVILFTGIVFQISDLKNIGLGVIWYLIPIFTPTTSAC